MKLTIDGNLYGLICDEIYLDTNLDCWDTPIDEYNEIRLKRLNIMIINYGILMKPFLNDKTINNIQIWKQFQCGDNYSISIKISDCYGALWKISNLIEDINMGLYYSTINIVNYKTIYSFMKKIILLYGKY